MKKKIKSNEIEKKPKGKKGKIREKKRRKNENI